MLAGQRRFDPHRFMALPRALALLLLTATANGALTVSNTLGSNMVLQRGKPAPIWGWAAAGTKVSVSFGEKKLSAVAAAGDGLWKVQLPAQEASLLPKSINIIAGADVISLGNVLFGDVILCSGQSKYVSSAVLSPSQCHPCGHAPSSLL